MLFYLVFSRVFGMRLATILFAGIIVVGQAVFAVGAFQNHFGTMEGARYKKNMAVSSRYSFRFKNFL